MRVSKEQLHDTIEEADAFAQAKGRKESATLLGDIALDLRDSRAEVDALQAKLEQASEEIKSMRETLRSGVDEGQLADSHAEVADLRAKLERVRKVAAEVVIHEAMSHSVHRNCNPSDCVLCKLAALLVSNPEGK